MRLTSRLALALLSAVPLALSAQQPRATFTAACTPAAPFVCTVDGSRSTGATSYRWDWGDGRSESHTRPTASNTWGSPGLYAVTLTVTGSGGTDRMAQTITVPSAPRGVRVDTVRLTRTDTLRILRVDTLTLPARVDTIYVPMNASIAALPRAYLNTAAPVAPAPGGKILSVPIGANLQAAFNAAQPGDVVELANGGTWSGNFILPNKVGAGWITVRPANMAAVPREGSRMTPAAASAAQLPLILSTSNLGAIATDPGAHHWRLVALEISVPATIQNTGLVRLGSGIETTAAQVSHDVVLDRLYIHGTPTGAVRRGVALNGAYMAVVDSYISECHDYGPDSQAIGGWNGSGPFKITNNYLEAASENVMFGGVDPTIAGLIPADIEIRRNHMTKQRAWFGRGYNVKALFEIKNAERVLVEGNVFEANWGDGQGGSSINLKSVNQSGACTWCVARDITFRYNIVRNAGSGLNLSGRDPQPKGMPVPMTRVSITDNLFDGINVSPYDGDGRGVLLNSGPVDLVIAHNTMIDPTNSAITFGGPTSEPPVRFIFRDNIVGGGLYGVKGPGLSRAATFLAFPPKQFAGNVITTLGADIPAGNYFPASLAAIGMLADRRLGPASPYKGKGTDTRDPGANVPAVLAATAGVVQ